MSDLIMRREATISPCGKYRYRLSRRWGDGPEVAFVMLNPSTADASIDDPTIRKCMGFAQRWGMNGIHVVNLFAVRATKPADMMNAVDPVGPENMDHVARLCEAAAQSGGQAVCAWGTKGAFREQDKKVMKILHGLAIEPLALKITKDGHPQHPLYVSHACEPIHFSGRP